MRALRFTHFASLDALELAEVATPAPSAGDVRVHVRAAGLNPSDVKNVYGGFPYTTVPRVPGRDFAGVVTEGPEHLLGREVWGSGKELGFTRDGTHAEYVLVPATGVSIKPATLSFEQAASCPVPYLTALEALDRAHVTHETRVVIIGSGAVARAAAALAHARDARILIAARTTHRIAATLSGSPAESFALTNREQFTTAMRDHFDGGADVIFDTTGHWLPAAVDALAPWGRICAIAAPPDGHEHLPLRDLYRRGGTLIGINSLLHDTTAAARMLDGLRTDFEAGRLLPPGEIIGRTLDEAIDAYRGLDSGQRHKCVLTPAAGR